VREAVINAVAPADYAQRGTPCRIAIFDDRLEIENPGLLPFGLTIEDLPRGVSKLRNRVIGRVFHLPSALGRRRWKRPTGPSSMPWRVARGCSRARSQGRST